MSQGIVNFWFFFCSLVGVNGCSAWFSLFVVREVNFYCCLGSSNIVFRDLHMAVFSKIANGSSNTNRFP